MPRGCRPRRRRFHDKSSTSSTRRCRRRSQYGRQCVDGRFTGHATTVARRYEGDDDSNGDAPVVATRGDDDYAGDDDHDEHIWS